MADIVVHKRLKKLAAVYISIPTCLLLAGCNSSENQDYLAIEPGYGLEKHCHACVSKEEYHLLAKTKTRAQIENECQKIVFKAKQNEMDVLFQKIITSLIKMSKEGKIKGQQNKIIDSLIETQKQFTSFVGLYAKKNAEQYLRTYSYHYFGAMFDLVNMRIKHLTMLVENFDPNLLSKQEE